MAKRKTATPRRRTAASADTENHDAETAVDSATEQVETAREQLRTAEELLEQARDKIAPHVAWLRDKTTGELIDTSLDFVRKHPGLSIMSAASLGFIFARLFRR